MAPKPYSVTCAAPSSCKACAWSTACARWKIEMPTRGGALNCRRPATARYLRWPWGDT